jgi:uncharacterized damage-inducible protein DinB
MYTIQKHLQYNAWANQKLVEILAGVDDNILNTEVKSSFPTIKKTVLHICDAHQLWLTRLKGGLTPIWPSEQFTGGKDELLKLLTQSSQDLVDFIATKDRSFIESSITYHNMKHIEYTNVIEEILFHVVNHSTFHRGQLITMMRQLGFTSFENTDLSTYFRLF